MPEDDPPPWSMRRDVIFVVGVTFEVTTVLMLLAPPTIVTPCRSACSKRLSKLVSLYVFSRLDTADPSEALGTRQLPDVRRISKKSKT